MAGLTVGFAQKLLVVHAHLLAGGLLEAAHQRVEDAFKAHRPVATPVAAFPLHFYSLVSGTVEDQVLLLGCQVFPRLVEVDAVFI